jgi:hypothetical protein
LVPQVFALFLVLHGFAHLVGTAGSLTAIDEGTSVPYLGGRWDVSDAGTLRLLALLWAIAAVGYLVVAIATSAGWPWARTALIGVTVFSLLLSLAALWVAVVGVVIDVALLAVAIPKHGRLGTAMF